MSLQFNSHPFIFGLFPLCAAVFWLIPSLDLLLHKGKEEQGSASLRIFRARRLWLILISAWFYHAAGLFNVSALIISMIVNYACFTGIRKYGPGTPGARRFLAAGSVFNAGALLYFKYAGLFLGHTLALPLAISFYSFQEISFLADAYRGGITSCSIPDYLLYILYFPRLLQGPIVRYGEIREEFDRMGESRPDAERIMRALLLFSMGLCKKVLIADTIGRAVDYGYGNAFSLIWMESLITALSYPLQLYFDFSGYCDMGMAVSDILGIRLPLNFDRPYLATNPADFWRRWHSSLSRFLTKYVYIPLGGSREGVFKTCRNAMTIFLISGIWHGSTAGFLIWGAMHGILYILYVLLCKGRPEKQAHLLPLWIRALPMYLYWALSMIFFRAPSLSAALRVIRSIFDKPWFRMNPPLAEKFMLNEFWYLLKMTPLADMRYGRYIPMWSMLIFAYALVFSGTSAERISRRVKPGTAAGLSAAVLFVWGVLSVGVVSTFVYFNF